MEEGKKKYGMPILENIRDHVREKFMTAWRCYSVTRTRKRSEKTKAQNEVQCEERHGLAEKETVGTGEQAGVAAPGEGPCDLGEEAWLSVKKAF